MCSKHVLVQVSLTNVAVMAPSGAGLSPAHLTVTSFQYLGWLSSCHSQVFFKNDAGVEHRACGELILPSPGWPGTSALLPVQSAKITADPFCHDHSPPTSIALGLSPEIRLY